MAALLVPATCRTTITPTALHHYEGRNYLAFRRAQKVKSAPGSDARIMAMRAVVNAAAGNAQVLVAYANELALGGQPDEALREYERAAHIWPDYTTACYRYAIALANKEQSLLRREESRSSASEQYASLKRNLTLPLFFLRKLSVRERNQTVNWSTWPAAKKALELASLVAETSDVDVHDFVRSLRRHERYALVNYNAACVLARQARRASQQLGRPPTGVEDARRAAQDCLRTILVCPDADRVSGSWMAIDPDLDVVRETAVDVASRLPKEALAS